jgi:glycosyltransferase involved in cell wall biosynthesis
MVHERKRLIVCCTPFFGDDWAWYALELTAPDVRWCFFTDHVKHRWQRLLQRPNFNTVIAGLRTAWIAKRRRADLIITMDPRITFWVALWSRVLAVDTPHIAYSFNFPELPRGWKRRLFSYAYERVDALRVHSNMEIQLYHDYFSIPKDRIHLSLWSMNPPDVEPGGSLIIGDYMTAIGGNSRDYQTLLAACWKTPEIPMVWVVRPENVAGLDLPPHVRVFCNTSYPVAMNYLAHSRAMVLPLKGAEVPCGHVTLVSAMFLGKAILATDSAGIHDYVAEGVTGMLCRPADPEHMVSCMRLLWRDRELNERMGENGLRFAETFCTESHARDEMREYLAGCGLTASAKV